MVEALIVFSSKNTSMKEVYILLACQVATDVKSILQWKQLPRKLSQLFR